jgi:hypothetical protein
MTVGISLGTFEQVNAATSEPRIVRHGESLVLTWSDTGAARAAAVALLGACDAVERAARSADAVEAADG